MAYYLVAHNTRHELKYSIYCTYSVFCFLFLNHFINESTEETRVSNCLKLFPVHSNHSFWWFKASLQEVVPSFTLPLPWQDNNDSKVLATSKIAHLLADLKQTEVWASVMLVMSKGENGIWIEPFNLTKNGDAVTWIELLNSTKNGDTNTQTELLI